MNNKIALAAALFASSLLSVAQADTVTNGSFESPALTPTYCYLGTGTITCPQGLDGWSGNSSAVVIQTGNDAWGSQVAQSGNQFVGLQYVGPNVVNGQISQMQNVDIGGMFELTWYDVNREQYGGTATYQVLFDTLVLGTFTTSTGAWTPRSVTFSLGDGTIGALAFNVIDGTPYAGTQDSTSFIDSVALNRVPEPGSLALAGLALAGALMVRRRKA